MENYEKVSFAYDSISAMNETAKQLLIYAETKYEKLINDEISSVSRSFERSEVELSIYTLKDQIQSYENILSVLRD